MTFAPLEGPPPEEATVKCPRCGEELHVQSGRQRSLRTRARYSLHGHASRHHPGLSTRERSLLADRGVEELQEDDVVEVVP